MHPILLKYQLPARFAEIWGPESFFAKSWLIWVIGLMVSGIIAWWGLAPDVGKGRRALGWLATLSTLGFALILAGVGLGRLRFVQLHSYGVLIAVGFLVGIILAVREARRVGEDAERILDLAFWVLIAAMLGARLFYILIHWPEYAQDFKQSNLPWHQWKVFRLWEGGLIFYGGFLLALITSFLFVRLNRMNFWKLADIVAPSLALGQFFGLLGSYAAGFGWGKISKAPWAVVYDQGPEQILRGASLHPTQLYEALGLLFLFVLLLWLRSERRSHGQAFLAYLLLYPLLSFTLEFFQDDRSRDLITKVDLFPSIPGVEILSWSQASALVVFALGIVFAFQRSQAKDA